MRLQRRQWWRWGPPPQRRGARGRSRARGSAACGRLQPAARAHRAGMWREGTTRARDGTAVPRWSDGLRTWCLVLLARPAIAAFALPMLPRRTPA
eukprot:360512-Chlamydomonas_euryale.AAC.7